MDRYRPLLIKNFRPLALTLCICYGLSLLARWHWFADLFSHFTLQYAIGGLLIGAVLLAVRDWKWAAVAVTIFLLNATELGRHVGHAAEAVTPARNTVTIVQYNRNVGPKNQDALKSWLSANASRFDIVIIQEASPGVSTIARELIGLYPYQIHEPRDHAFGMVILSRHEFEGLEKILFPDQPYNNFSARVIIHPPPLKHPVAIYALHAVPPMSDALWHQRNYELQAVAERVGADKTPHRVMIGDWNITPYSPFYGDVLRASGLDGKARTIMPQPTWPALGFPWLTQIPIDHVLPDTSLRLVTQKREAPTHSDHYALIATFAEK